MNFDLHFKEAEFWIDRVIADSCWSKIQEIQAMAISARAVIEVKSNGIVVK